MLSGYLFDQLSGFDKTIIPLARALWRPLIGLAILLFEVPALSLTETAG